MVPFCDQGVASAANVLIGIILARAADKSEFGLYTLGLTVIMFGLNVQTALIWTPYTVFLPRMTGRPRATLSGSTLLHQLTTSAAMIAVITSTCLVLELRSFDQRFVWLFAALSITILPYLLREYCRRFFFANLEFLSALKFDSFVAASQVALLLILLTTYYLSAVIVFLILAFTTGVSAVSSLWRNRRRFEVDTSRVGEDWRANWRFGRWALGSSLLWSVQAYAMPWVIAQSRGLDSAGAWAACIGAIAIGNPFLLATQNFVGPVLASTWAETGTAGLSSRVFRFMAMVGSASVAYVIAFVIGGQVLVLLMYGPEYSNLGLVLSVLALNFAFSLVQVPLTSALFVLDRVRIDFVINLVSLAAFGSAVMPAVGRFGLAGGAVVLAACSGASLLAKVCVFTLITKLEDRTPVGSDA